MVLALFLMVPVPALAKGEADEPAYLLGVKRSYEDLEYERALGQLARARALARTIDEDVILSLYEGVILADMNRWEESAEAFKKALFLRPDAKLPLKVAPKVAQHFENVRQQVHHELEPKSKPPAAPSQLPPPRPDSSAQAQKPPPVVPERRPETKPRVAEQQPSVPDITPSAPTEVAERSFLRPRFLGPAIGGGVLLVAGGASWAMSRRELSRLRNDDSTVATLEDSLNTASRGKTYQTVGVGLLGAGLVGLGFAVGLYAFETPSNPEAFSMGTNGTSIFVQGRWQ